MLSGWKLRSVTGVLWAFKHDDNVGVASITVTADILAVLTDGDLNVEDTGFKAIGLKCKRAKYQKNQHRRYFKFVQNT